LFLSAQLFRKIPSSNIIDELYDQVNFGLTPRLCREISYDPQRLKKYRETISRSEMWVSLENVRRVIDELEEDLNLDKDLESIFENLLVIWRSDTRNVESKVYAAPITEHMRIRLANAMEIDG
jgi:hypothetical protein